ncbi:MAG TPA: serine/threonine-protein kinase, partial [Isosphaeraceae bacterium]|nr:serine/threonine-protein kinase [Isosphaeraceae bacterium]
MGRKEVLKVVGSHVINSRGVLDRFLGEIRNAAQLHHPNIVTAYSALRMGESLVLAMEYVEGLDLAKLVKVRGPLPVANACYYVHQAALGLQHAHEHGMVHRDIKPGNLMRARRGNREVVKVLDFGLAKVSREVPADGTLTYEGQMLGTPDFIAPEQSIDARKADIRADIYSLGCTLYYLLTGGPPFQGTSLYDILQAHHSRDAMPLNLARLEVPVELAALVGKMMAKEPERRFQTPAEVSKALVPFFKPGANPGSRPTPEIPRVGQAASSPQPVAGGSAPAKPATLGAAPAPAPRVPSKPNPEGVAWESLIEIKETEPSTAVVKPKREVAPSSAPAPVRRPPWVWASAASGVLLLGLLAAWLGVFKVKTPDGVIVLENVPKDSEILVDGNKITFTWPGVGKSLEIRAVPGQRKVEVKKDGFTIFAKEMTVKTDGSEEITVRLEPRVVALPGKKEPITRAITDSMLVITTNNNNVIANAGGNFLDQVNPNIQATLRDDNVYINEAFGLKDVLCTEALSSTSPATIDFGRITKDRTGSLTLLVHGYPGHRGQRIVVKSDDDIINEYIVHFADGWKKIEVPFRRNEIVVEHHAEGWMMEFLFIDYSIVSEPTPTTKGMGGVTTGRGREGGPGHQAPKTITNSLGMTSPTSPTIPAMVDGVREGVLLSTGEMDSPSQWLYTTVNPGAEWASPQFDTRQWTPGLPAFGQTDLPNIPIRTRWETPEIWLRTSVVVPRLSPSHVLILRLWNDDDVDIYVNGKLLIQRHYEGNDYGEIFLDDSQKALFHKGKNTLAVRCVNTAGPAQIIDVRLRFLLKARDPSPTQGLRITIAKLGHMER